MLWSKPVLDEKCYMSSPYGMRIHPIEKKRKLHKGYDLSCGGKVEIHSIHSGHISYNDTGEEGWGYYARLYYVKNGIEFICYYGHLDRKYSAMFNDRNVEAGGLIGFMGNSGFSKGQHTHMEIRYYNKDKKKWISFDYRNPKNEYYIDYLVKNWYGGKSK